MNYHLVFESGLPGPINRRIKLLVGRPGEFIDLDFQDGRRMATKIDRARRNDPFRVIEAIPDGLCSIQHADCGGDDSWFSRVVTVLK
jgi:hypothetical protein